MDNFEKVILISPSRLYADYWSEGGEIGTNFPALELLKASVKDKIPVDIIDLPNTLGVPKSNRERRDFLAGLDAVLAQKEWRGTLVGISCWSALHYLSTLEVAKRLKALDPSVKIVVGGYHPTTVPEDFEKYPELFDHIVKGPGEQALNGILEGATDRVFPVHQAEGTPIELMSQVPPEEPLELYYIYLSRGCIYRCSFCVESSMGTKWRALTPRDASSLIVDLDRSKKVGQIAVCDPCFGSNRAWRQEFLGYLIQAGVTTPLWAEARIDSFDDKDVELLSKLYFKIDFGIESGSPTMLKLMNKTGNPEKFLQNANVVCRKLDRANVPFSLYFILNFPGETPQTMDETYRFMEGLKRDVRNQKEPVSYQEFFLVPGTEIAKLPVFCDKKGRLKRQYRWWTKKICHRRAATRISFLTGMRQSLEERRRWIAKFNDIAKPSDLEVDYSQRSPGRPDHEAVSSIGMP